MFDRFDDETMP